MSIFKSFGKNPIGDRLKAIKQSPNYKKEGFQNQSPTPVMELNGNLLKSIWSFIDKPSNTRPSVALPFVNADLLISSGNDCSIFWFGHSSYLIKIGTKNILVDPVFSGHASPFTIGGKSFTGTDRYGVDDMPDIDLLIISHDHYDHLDNRTLVKLMPKVKTICTSLGVGSHLEYWGLDKKIITELDWWQSHSFDTFKITAAPARHFSGRSLKRGKTFWSSFILTTGSFQLYLGADSGYDSHFKTIGEKFNSFDIAILETGQYNVKWPYIHMMPEEAVQAAAELNAKMLLPVHWGKFALAMHPWYEPVERAIAKAKELNIQITTPMIGEPVILNESYPSKKWWEDYKN